LRKYSYEIEKKVLELLQLGLSSRKVADYLAISKSGVNNIRNRSAEQKENRSKTGPKILVFDLETSASLVYCFGRHKQYINQDAVVSEGGKILCAGYQWLDDADSTVIAYSEDIKLEQDYKICFHLWCLFNQADAVVAHNALQFDIKMLETRCLANGLPPLPHVKVIDTLILAKKNFRFPSNKLDSLASYLDIGRKVTHSGIDLWVKVQQGCNESLQKMVEYCKGDTDLLVEVYKALRSRGIVGTDFNAAHYYADNMHRCKVCGSDNLESTGRTANTAISTFDEVRCNDCGAIHRTRSATNSKTKRASILVNTKH